MGQLKVASYSFLLIFFILLNCIVFFTLQANYNEQIRNIEKQSMLSLESRYNYISKNLKLLADIYFTEVINQKPILEILKDLPTSNSLERDIIRKKLYDQIAPIYKRMEKLDFRQVHFHTIDNSSFLRMHKPNIYGDSLTNIRDTIVQTNKTLISQHGFEEGRIYNGFRNVYPIIYNGKHLGSVELSLSFNALRSMMERTYENHFAFMVSKSTVDTKVFKDQIVKNYLPSYIDENFYFEKRYTNHKLYNTMKNHFNHLSSDQINFIHDNLNEFKSFSIISSDTKNNFELSFLAVYNTKGNPVAYIISNTQNPLFSALKQQYEKQILFLISISFFLLAISIVWILYGQKKTFENRSNTDPLTKAYNRTKFYDDYEEVHTNRATDKPFCLMMIDIDDFKQVNDKFGHSIGDHILIDFTKVLKNSIRSSDSIYRWGGEEFIITVHEPIESVKKIANKIIKNTNKNKYTHNIKVSCSIGISCYKEKQTIDDLVKLADDQMYLAKKAGKNQFKF